MATNPKMKACPKCDSVDYLAVYSYESGWRYVECDRSTCCYRGPGAGSIRAAIKAHNEHTSSCSAPVTPPSVLPDISPARGEIA